MLPYSLWLKTSLGTRYKIASIFGFNRKRPTHVSNNEIVDDGFDLKDIEENLSVVNLQKYLNVEGTDIVRLFDMAVDKMEGRVQIKESASEAMAMSDSSEPNFERLAVSLNPIIKKKRGRPLGYSPKKHGEITK